MVVAVRVLRVDSSASTGTGQSRRLADRIVAGLGAAGAPLDVTTRDLADPPPPVDRAWIEANTTLAKDRSPEQAATLALSEVLIGEIEAADLLILGLPVYNFAPPASLKLWIDQVCRARRTFVYSEGGPKGLMKGKRAIVCFVSGGTAFGSRIDFASGYIRHILGFIGIEEVSFVTADRHFMDDGALGRADAAADAIVDQTVEVAVP